MKTKPTPSAESSSPAPELPEDPMQAFLARGGKVETLLPGERGQPVYRSMRDTHTDTLRLAKELAKDNGGSRR